MDKKNNRINHKQFFSMLFFCVTLLVYTACFMIENGGITYNSVIGAAVNILPYCFAVGFLGYIMGIILDKPKKVKPKYDKNMIDKLVNDLSAQERISMPPQMEANIDNPMSISDDFDIKVNTEADGQ